ncbi:hypothetical protein SLS62_004358 [Diatrype stigma]|uniref:Cellulase n=1 Tax=Diatrype stigma TaxID=117547 RepID=A0AAN9V3B9_9PEZI
MQQKLLAAVLGTSLPLLARAQDCSVVNDVAVTFYGSPDNDPPGSAATAYSCGGRDNQAGGVGSYDDPLTFATAPGEYEQCELLYAPYIKKYIRMEDSCEQCTSDWANGEAHIDIWTGTVADGGDAQVECENELTPGPQQSFIRNPAADLEVDVTPLWDNGACNTQNTYPDYNTGDYCGNNSGGGGGGGGSPPTCQTGCEWEGHCIGKQSSPTQMF